MDHLALAIKIVGSQAELARRLNVSGQAITNWMGGKSMSPESAAAIERETGGEVKADQLAPSVSFVRDKSGSITGYTIGIKKPDVQKRRAA